MLVTVGASITLDTIRQALTKGSGLDFTLDGEPYVMFLNDDLSVEVNENQLCHAITGKLRKRDSEFPEELHAKLVIPSIRRGETQSCTLDIRI
jgi:hypothetical protein